MQVSSSWIAIVAKNLISFRGCPSNFLAVGGDHACEMITRRMGQLKNEAVFLAVDEALQLIPMSSRGFLLNAARVFHQEGPSLH